MRSLYNVRVELSFKCLSCLGVIKITIKKYMVIDLAMLVAFGTIAEAIALYVIPTILQNAFPFYCASMLVCILAVTRWNWKGIVVAPVMALITVVLGRVLANISNYDEVNDLAKYYNWKVFLTNLITFLSALIVLPIKKFVKKKETFSDRLFVEMVTAIILVVSIVAQIFAYSLVTLAAPSNYAAVFVINDLPAVIITLIFMAVLRHQGIFVDAKQDLISKKEEAEMENMYYQGLRKEVIERSNNEDNSSKK